MLTIHNTNYKTLKYQSGFSMIEVLVTVLVLSFGLLGMANLITTGMRANTTAQFRSIATQQTLDMVDRMRANLAGVRAGSYDAIAADIPVPDDCFADECDLGQIATYDQAQWNTTNAAVLPNGEGTVDVDVINGGFSITLMWVEKDKRGIADLTCPPGTAVDRRCFVTRMSP